MTEFEEYQTHEALLWAENDLPLMIHLDFDFYNHFAQQKMKNSYDHAKAVQYLNDYFFPRIMHRYLIETGNKTIYGMSKAQKSEVSEALLEQLEEQGGYVLENVPLNEITGRIKLRDVGEIDDYYNRERVKAYEIPRNSMRRTNNGYARAY